MTTTSAPLSPLACNWFWPALLAVAAVGGSWALACVTPFAAFAAMLATTESRRTVLGTMVLIWFANQAVGVVALGYPLDVHSIGWGLAIGAAALLATAAASAVAQTGLRHWLRLVLAFVAAFAAMLAATESRRTAFGTMALIWFANQAVGVAALGYPLDVHSVGWGVAIGVAALLGTAAASAMAQTNLPRALRLVLAFVAAFAVYEIALALVAAATGELAEFTPTIVARLAALDAAWLAALVVLREALALTGWRILDSRRQPA